MNFEELGLILRQARERRGLSIEEVADRLKLMPRIVRALEQADVEALPQAAYARGFVKAYGNLLELEPELLYAGMEDAWPDDSQPPIPYEPVQEGPGGKKGRLAICISLVLILAIAGGFWFFRDLNLHLPSGVLPRAEPAISAKNELPSPSTNKAQNIQPPESRNQTVARQTSPPSVASPLPVAVPSALSSQLGSPAVPTDSRRTENVPGPTPQAALAPADSSAVTQDSPRNLVIIALAECWVHSNADHTDTRQFSLRKGDTFALTFSKKLVLKLGNAGGVRLRLDGRDLDPPGEVGQVKTLTFPSNP